MAASNILIVEDDANQAELLKKALMALGHRVLGPARDCSSALELIWRERPDLAFVDTHLGSETCEAVLEECDNQSVPVVITLGDGDDLPAFCGDRNRMIGSLMASTLQEMLEHRPQASS